MSHVSTWNHTLPLRLACGATATQRAGGGCRGGRWSERRLREGATRSGKLGLPTSGVTVGRRRRVEVDPSGVLLSTFLGTAKERGFGAEWNSPFLGVSLEQGSETICVWTPMEEVTLGLVQDWP